MLQTTLSLLFDVLTRRQLNIAFLFIQIMESLKGLLARINADFLNAS